MSSSIKCFIAIFVFIILVITGFSSGGFTQSSEEKLNFIRTENFISSSYYLLPYQTSWESPIITGYYAPAANQVHLEVKNLSSGTSSTLPLASSGNGYWKGEIPVSMFKRGEQIQILYNVVGHHSTNLEWRLPGIVYSALKPPDAYKEPDLSNPKLLIVAFQEKADSSPVFNVFWPDLYYSKSSPYPLAARIQASKSPANSIIQFHPVQERPGWFQFQVPTVWFSPGEEIVADFLSGSGAPFAPLETVQLKTLAPNSSQYNGKHYAIAISTPQPANSNDSNGSPSSVYRYQTRPEKENSIDVSGVLQASNEGYGAWDVKTMEGKIFHIQNPETWVDEAWFKSGTTVRIEGNLRPDIQQNNKDELTLIASQIHFVKGNQVKNVPYRLQTILKKPTKRAPFFKRLGDWLKP